MNYLQENVNNKDIKLEFPVGFDGNDVRIESSNNE